MAATRSRGKEMTTMSNQNATKAILRSARISPQKARLVADQVRGLSAERAVNLLQCAGKTAAHPIKQGGESWIAHDGRNQGDALGERRYDTCGKIEAESTKMS